MGAGSLPGVKQQGRGVDYPPLLTLRLKNPPLGIRSLLKGQLYLLFILRGFPLLGVHWPHEMLTGRGLWVLFLCDILTDVAIRWPTGTRTRERVNCLQPKVLYKELLREFSLAM